MGSQPKLKNRAELCLLQSELSDNDGNVLTTVSAENQHVYNNTDSESAA